jgi:hypothetical protein
MTRLAQVRHVVAKDVREVRWVLVAYLALVVFATVRAAGWVPSSSAIGFPLMIAIVITGVLATALVVQSDSPTRAGAFWTKLPLDPMAVVGAKAFFASGLIVIGIGAQVLSVASYGVDAMDAIGLAGDGISAFGFWLVLGSLLAAVLSDLRAFILAFILLPLVLFIALNLVAFAMIDATGGYAVFSGSIPGAGPTVGVILAAAVHVGSLGLIVWLYRTRDVSRWARVGGLLLAAALFVPFGGLDFGSPPDELIPEADRISFRLESGGAIGAAPSRGSDDLQLVLHAPPMPQHLSFSLPGGVLVVGLHDGSMLRLPVSIGLSSQGGWMPRLPGIRWLEPPPTAGAGHGFSVSLTEAHRQALEQGVRSMTLEGDVHLFEASVTLSLPKTVDREIVHDGRRITVEQWRIEPNGPVVVARESGLDQVVASRLSTLFMGDRECVFVNSVRGEGVTLPQTSRGGAIDALVLPGIPVSSERWQCGGSSYRPDMLRPSADWFRDAELLLVARVHRGSYPVRLELPM